MKVPTASWLLLLFGFVVGAIALTGLALSYPDVLVMGIIVFSIVALVAGIVLLVGSLETCPEVDLIVVPEPALQPPASCYPPPWNPCAGYYYPLYYARRGCSPNSSC